MKSLRTAKIQLKISRYDEFQNDLNKILNEAMEESKNKLINLFKFL